jgi:hypothetical protein
MAWADMALDGSQSLMQNVGSYLVASAERKSQRKWQAFNNKMTRLQNAMNQNALTTNQGMAVERSQEQAFNIRKSEYITKSSVEVAAAATGTTGRSVDLVLFEVGKNAAAADRARAQDLTYELMGIDQQKQASSLQTEMQVDRTYLPKPNAAAYAMNFAGDIGKLWKDHGRPSLR